MRRGASAAAGRVGNIRNAIAPRGAVGFSTFVANAPGLARRNTLSHWLTNPHRLVVRSEEDFAVKRTLRFNYAKIIVFGGLTVVLLCVLSFYLTLGWITYRTAAGGEELRARRQLLRLHTTADSLLVALQQRDEFINGFRRVVYDNGALEAEAQALEEAQTDVLREGITPTDLEELTDVDRRWRADFEGKGGKRAARPGATAGNVPLETVEFFTPIKGMISSDFESKIGHFGVDVVSKTNEPVRCVADGTVLLASWTEDTGYTIAVQHANDLVSIYKHNASLTRKVGNVVKAGEKISVIGNTGELTTGPHLHFELWHQGSPVDPKEYISF